MLFEKICKLWVTLFNGQKLLTITAFAQNVKYPSGNVREQPYKEGARAVSITIKGANHW